MAHRTDIAVVLVDTTVWIDFFNGRPTPESEWLDAALGHLRIVTGDLIVTEVLQGFREDGHHAAARAALLALEPQPMVGPRRALLAADNYRNLRRRGVTVRKTMDCLIATFCIDADLPLLHCDRDFDAFEVHLGLEVVHL